MEFSVHRKSLLNRLADGRFHSGPELASALGVSRTAIWKFARELRDLGLEVNAVSGKGYRLARPLELLNEAAIIEELSEAAKSCLSGLEIHDQLDSTNTRLMNRAAAGAPSGTVCLAEHQTSGRGRIGRSWHSPFGDNVYLSVLWRYQEHAAMSGLSLAVGVAIMRTLRRAGVEGVGLKWPNDMLWQGRKLGGILLEVSGEAYGCCAVVVGIGINLHIHREAGEAIDQPWVDLNQIAAGKVPSRNRLIGLLLDELIQLLVNYPGEGLRAYIQEWRQWHCHAGSSVILEMGEKSIRGVVADVSDEGLLVLDCEDGGRRQFASGDLRLRTVDQR